MNNLELKGGYVSPECEELAIMLEGSILTSSTDGSLGVFDDNNIYGETF